MIASLFAWVMTGKNWQIVGLGAVVVGTLIFWRVDRVSQWNKGVADGRKDGVAQMEKMYKDTWKQALAKLDEQTKAEEKKNAEIAKNLSAIAAKTGAVMTSLDKLTALTITLTAEEREHNRAAANAIPAGELNDTLRALAGEINRLVSTSEP